MPQGLFLVLDGPDGCGKSTQAAWLVERLKKQGRRAVHLREPGGTALGEALRAMLLHSQLSMDASSEAFLFMAARAQLARERIAPALAQGDVVVCERWTSSTVAYQGVAGGFGVDRVMELGKAASAGPEPHLLLLLDVPPAVGFGRVSRGLDRMERKGEEYHARVREGFRRCAGLFPAAAVLDATRSIDAVAADVWGRVEILL
jgi:dTMP kinase